MFRYYRSFVDRVFMLLSYTRYNTGEGLDDIRTWFHRYVENGPHRETAYPNLYGAHRNILQNDRNRLPDDAPENSISTMMEVIGAQINHHSAGGRADDATLIDDIVLLLKLPYGRASMGSVIPHLRQALIIPSEMAAVQRSIKEREHNCTGCGHKFVGGEMITFYLEPSGPSFLCNMCRKPTLIACQAGGGCHGVVDIRKKLGKELYKDHLCVTHDPANKEKQQQTPRDDLREFIAQAAGGMVEAAGLAQPRRGRPFGGDGRTFRQAANLTGGDLWADGNGVTPAAAPPYPPDGGDDA